MTKDKKPFVSFNDAANQKRELLKDNAQPRIKPPHIATQPQSNLAPMGMTGTRFQITNTFTPHKKPFTPEQGDLKREFQSLVSPNITKSRDFER
jgi:hypothetical protein